MKKEIRNIDIDLEKYKVYLNTETDEYIALTLDEWERVALLVSREQFNSVNIRNIDPAAMAEGVKLSYDKPCNTYHLGDGSLQGFSIKNLDFVNVDLIFIAAKVNI